MDIRIERVINDLESAERQLQRLQAEAPLPDPIEGDVVFFGEVRAEINAALGRVKGREAARQVVESARRKRC